MTRAELVSLIVAGLFLAVGAVLLVAGGLVSGLFCIGLAATLAWRLYRSW